MKSVKSPVDSPVGIGISPSFILAEKVLVSLMHMSSNLSFMFSETEQTCLCHWMSVPG